MHIWSLKHTLFGALFYHIEIGIYSSIGIIFLKIHGGIHMEKRMISVGEAESKAREFADDRNYDELFELADRILSQEIVFGAETDYHNFVMNYLRCDAYDVACDILEKGLKQFPHSVDLMSDYLQSGINCNRIPQCEQYFSNLIQIPKVLWTWRGFSFAIDYLLFRSKSLRGEELDSAKASILLLDEEYASLFPTDEDPYLCKADILRAFNDYSGMKDALIYATEHILVCPKCCLRLADSLFDEGAYEEAASVIEKCKYQSIQTQDSINHAYLYYLSGLCKTAMLLKSSSLQDKQYVQDIYHDFSIAQKAGLQRGAYLRILRRQLDMLETLTGVEYTD